MCPVLGLPALHVPGCLLAAPSLLSPRKHKFQNVTQLGQGVRGWTLCVRFAGRLLHLKRNKNKKVCAIPLCQMTNPGVLYEASWPSDFSWFGQESSVHGPNTKTDECIRSNFQGGWQQEWLSLSKDVGTVLYHVVQVLCACRLCILFWFCWIYPTCCKAT